MKRVEENRMPLLVRFAIFVAKVINYVVNLISNKLPFSLAVIVTSLIFSLPVVGAWSIFLFSYYLPPPWGGVLIWALMLVVVTLAAAADYLRST